MYSLQNKHSNLNFKLLKDFIELASISIVGKDYKQSVINNKLAKLDLKSLQNLCENPKESAKTFV